MLLVRIVLNTPTGFVSQYLSLEVEIRKSLSPIDSKCGLWSLSYIHRVVGWGWVKMRGGVSSFNLGSRNQEILLEDLELSFLLMHPKFILCLKLKDSDIRSSECK